MINETLDTISRHRTEQSRAASHKLELTQSVHTHPHTHTDLKYQIDNCDAENIFRSFLFCRLETHKTTRHLKPEIRDPKVEELQRKLEAKREERLREQSNARITPEKRSATRLKQLAKDKVSVEY